MLSCARRHLPEVLGRKTVGQGSDAVRMKAGAEDENRSMIILSFDV